MALRYVAPALFRPKGITLQQNVPEEVMKEAFSRSFRAIWIWLYPKKPFTKENKYARHYCLQGHQYGAKGSHFLGWLYLDPNNQHMF